MPVLKFVVFFWLFLLVPAWALAEGVALKIEGSDGSVTEITLAELDAMEQVSFETTTIWTDGVVAFSGVSLSTLLNAAGISGPMLRMMALNDYSIDMPIDDIGEEFPIVATRMDGEEMSVRGKGPFWVVFPYDADPSFQTETIFARSVWQLGALSVMN